jgi:hypothetical protein
MDYGIRNGMHACLILFFNYGVETGILWESTPAHESMLWRHISWKRSSFDSEIKVPIRHGPGSLTGRRWHSASG